MNDLIKILENATGPSKAIDKELVIFAGKSTREGYTAEDWIPYTRSIDAALTLVPEGFKWKLAYSRHVPCNAELIDYRVAHSHPSFGRFDGECDSNHAIALCIAALKAREAF